jgi:hypothetical protein
VSTTSLAATFCSQVDPALRAGDDDQVVALGEHPGKRQLCRGHVLDRGETGDPLRDREVVLQIAALETRSVAAEVVLAEIPAGRQGPVSMPRPSGL